MVAKKENSGFGLLLSRNFIGLRFQIFFACFAGFLCVLCG
jgi:hypothetical protein